MREELLNEPLYIHFFIVHIPFDFTSRIRSIYHLRRPKCRHRRTFLKLWQILIMFIYIHLSRSFSSIGVKENVQYILFRRKCFKLELKFSMNKVNILWIIINISISRENHRSNICISYSENFKLNKSFPTCASLWKLGEMKNQ